MGNLTRNLVQQWTNYQMSDDGVQEVDVKIREWRTGQYGRYAIVDVISQDAPTTSALYSGSKFKGATPKVGTPFRCRIAKTPNGWRVTELVLNGFPDKLLSVTGTVREVLRSNKQPIWIIDALEDGDRPPTAISMDQKVLWNTHISEIDTGTLVIFDAIREPNGYRINKLHAPTAADALPGDTSSPVIAVIHQDWPTDRNSKGVGVSFRTEGATVSASCFVSSELIRGSGIRCLSKYTFPKTGDRYPTADESCPLIGQWSEILQTGAEEERAQLSVDRLELEVEWNEPTQQWRVARLVGPRSLRLPSADKEIIEWVKGVCQTPPAKQKKKDSPEALLSETSSTDDHYVYIEFDDPRVGCGSARYILHSNITDYAGLYPGVPVIVNLISNKQYWNVHKIHRSVPNRKPEENP